MPRRVLYSAASQEELEPFPNFKFDRECVRRRLLLINVHLTLDYFLARYDQRGRSVGVHHFLLRDGGSTMQKHTNQEAQALGERRRRI